jgi:membrane carboxypeptidase/penicillin-binding protein
MKAMELGEHGFMVPEGIVSYPIDPGNGLLARDPGSGVREYFKRGTQPRDYSSSPGIRETREPLKLDFD